MNKQLVAKALALNADPQQVYAFVGLYAEMQAAVPAEFLPPAPDRDHMTAELVADAHDFVVASRPGWRWATIRSPYTADRSPLIASVDLATFKPESGDPIRLLWPDFVISQLVELAHGYRLRMATPEGNA